MWILAKRWVMFCVSIYFPFPSTSAEEHPLSQNDGDGDKIQVGNVSGTGIAIGRKARASVSVTTGPTAAELDALFARLAEAVQGAAPERREQALQAVHDLRDEVTKGNDADDSTLAKLIDKLVDMVPGAVGTVVSTFAAPILGGIAGPVTKFVLDKFKRD